MGSVIQLKNKVNNAYLDLKNSVDDKIILVEEKIKNKLISDVSLVEKMTSYNLETGGKKSSNLLKQQHLLQKQLPFFYFFWPEL